MLLLTFALCYTFLKSASQIFDGPDFSAADSNTVQLWYVTNTDKPVTTTITETLSVNCCFQGNYKITKFDYYNRIVSYSLVSLSVYKQLGFSYSNISSNKSNLGFYYINLCKLII